MIISENLEIDTKSFVEYIKNVISTDKEQGMKLIGNLIETSNLSERKASKLFGLCRQTIKKSVSIFKGITNYKLDIETRGRKKIEEKYPEIIDQIKQICENTESVDKSLKDDIVYIDITAGFVISKLQSDYGYTISECPCENTIIRIFRECLKYKITKIKKSKVLKKIPETDAIFDNVNKKKEEVKLSLDNVSSYTIDTKATKNVGYVSDNGASWIEKDALDHDTNVEYKVKPFGISNMKTQDTTVYCNTNNATADFMTECLETQIKNDRVQNPNINKVYLFLDNGPENCSHRTLWIFNLIMIAIRLNITIELVYYPPYHSKYNPIEHYWGVLQRSWNGLIIDSLDKLIGAINGTKWHGINSKGILIDKSYEKGKSVDKTYLKKLIEQHITYPTLAIENWSLIITP